jgi:hypothetical protein
LGLMSLDKLGLEVGTGSFYQTINKYTYANIDRHSKWNSKAEFIRQAYLSNPKTRKSSPLYYFTRKRIS